MIQIRRLEKIFQIQFVTRNALHRLNNQISQRQFAPMISRLLFEKFVEGGGISAEANGNLSCFVIVDKTSIRLN